MINLTINGRSVQVEENTTILNAAQKFGVDIPYFCRDDRIKTRNCMEHGDCKMCSCKIDGSKSFVTACNNEVKEGMSVWTETEDVIEARKQILYQMIAKHPLDCLNCKKLGDCKLQLYCERYAVKEPLYEIPYIHREKDDTGTYFYTEYDKCISCGKCVRVCRELVGAEAIKMVQKGIEGKVIPTWGNSMSETNCMECGNCLSVCPVGAILPKHAMEYRCWETNKVRTTCLQCGIGCQMDLIIKETSVVDIKPAYGSLNHGLLCTKGKFGIDRINHPMRLTEPMLRKGEYLHQVTWEEALQVFVENLNHVRNEFGSESIAGILGSGMTEEEKELFEQLMIKIGSGKFVRVEDRKEAFESDIEELYLNLDVIKSRDTNSFIRCRPEQNLTVDVTAMRRAISLNKFSSNELHSTIGRECLDETLKFVYAIGEYDAKVPQNSFKVIQNMFFTEDAYDADIVLPSCSYAEKEGTFINILGDHLNVNKAIDCYGNAKDDGSILKVLLSLCS